MHITNVLLIIIIIMEQISIAALQALVWYRYVA